MTHSWHYSHFRKYVVFFHFFHHPAGVSAISVVASPLPDSVDSRLFLYLARLSCSKTKSPPPGPREIPSYYFTEVNPGSGQDGSQGDPMCHRALSSRDKPIGNIWRCGTSCHRGTLCWNQMMAPWDRQQVRMNIFASHPGTIPRHYRACHTSPIRSAESLPQERSFYSLYSLNIPQGDNPR